MIAGKTITEILLPSSKSESNRCLIIQALSSEKIFIKNLSNAEDTNILKSILDDFKTNNKDTFAYNVGHAGTAMRFLTAFFSNQEGIIVHLTGSNRMKERPISPLVKALKSIGADISYQEKEGFPPLLIKGKNLTGNELVIDASISSQYISALLLIAPKLTDGLTIHTKNKMVSTPYIEMTLKLLEQTGMKIIRNENHFAVSPQKPQKTTFKIEADWSSASYWYEYLALSPNTNLSIRLKGLKQDSLQGDSILPKLYEIFGIKTTFFKDDIIIEKTQNVPQQSFIEMNLENTPDLAQTIICTGAGLNLEMKINGLSTLVVKETNRLEALKQELLKFGVISKIIDNETFILSKGNNIKKPKNNIATYNDHRMAMAFAPLQNVVGTFTIENPEVVKKSYPNYWEEFRKLNYC